MAMSFKDRRRFEFEYTAGNWDYYTMRMPGKTEADERGVLVRIRTSSESGKGMREAAAKSGTLFSASLVETAEDVPVLESIRIHTPADRKASYIDRGTGKTVSVEFPQDLAELHENYMKKWTAAFGFAEMGKEFRRMAEGETFDLDRQFLRLAVSSRIEKERADMHKSLANATRRLFDMHARNWQCKCPPSDLLPIFTICLGPKAAAVSHRKDGKPSFFASAREEADFTFALIASKNEVECTASLKQAMPELTHPMASVMAKTWFRASEESRNMVRKQCGKSGLITAFPIVEDAKSDLYALARKMHSLQKSSGLDAIAVIISGELKLAIGENFAHGDPEKPSIDDFVSDNSKKDSPFSDGLWHEGEIQKLDEKTRDIFHSLKSALESRWDRHIAKTVLNNFGEIFALCSEGASYECSKLTEGDKRTVMAAAVSVFESRTEAKALKGLSAPDDRQYSIEELFDPKISVDSGRIALQPFGPESEDLCQKSIFLNTCLDMMAQNQAERALKSYYAMVESKTRANRLQMPNTQWFKGNFRGISMEGAELSEEGANRVYELARAAMRENYKAVNYILNGCRPLPSGDIADAKLVGEILDRLKKNGGTRSFDDIMNAAFDYSRMEAEDARESLLQADAEKFGAAAFALASEKRALVQNGLQEIYSVPINGFMQLAQALDSIG